MRRMVAVLAVLFVLIFAAASMAATPKMRQIYKDDISTYFLCVDTLVIKQYGKKPNVSEHAEMWVRRIYRAGTKDAEIVRWHDYHYEIVPDKRRLGLIETESKYASGISHRVKLPRSNSYLPFPSDLKDVSPGSVSEVIYEAINKAYKREKSWFKIF